MLKQNVTYIKGEKLNSSQIPAMVEGLNHYSGSIELPLESIQVFLKSQVPWLNLVDDDELVENLKSCLKSKNIG